MGRGVHAQMLIKITRLTNAHAKFVVPPSGSVRLVTKPASQRRCFRTKGLAVFLAQPKNRRFAGLGLVRAHVQEAQGAGRLLRWFV